MGGDAMNGKSSPESEEEIIVETKSKNKNKKGKKDKRKEAGGDEDDLDEILQALEVNDKKEGGGKKGKKKKKEVDDDMYDLEVDTSEKTDDTPSPTENGKEFTNGISHEPTTDATADETDDAELNNKKSKKKKGKDED